MKTTTTETSFGELIVALYEEYLDVYGDPDVASVAAAATINELLVESTEDEAEAVEAA